MRLRLANSCIFPGGWPMGQRSPKLRTEASRAFRSRSKRTTEYPRRARVHAWAIRMPAPTTATWARSSFMPAAVPVYGRQSQQEGCRDRQTGKAVEEVVPPAHATAAATKWGDQLSDDPAPFTNPAAVAAAPEAPHLVAAPLACVRAEDDSDQHDPDHVPAREVALSSGALDTHRPAERA
jgi:hypothetical protein